MVLVLLRKRRWHRRTALILLLGWRLLCTAIVVVLWCWRLLRLLESTKVAILWGPLLLEATKVATILRVAAMTVATLLRLEATKVAVRWSLLMPTTKVGLWEATKAIEGRWWTLRPRVDVRIAMVLVRTDLNHSKLEEFVSLV